MNVRVFFCLCLVASGCVGTEIGNPPTPTEQSNVAVDIVTVEDAPTPLPIGLIVAEGVDVERALWSVGDLRFRQSATCAVQGADHTDGFVSDLLGTQVEVDGVELPSGAYCGVDVRPSKGGDGGAAPEYPELDDITVYAEGTYLGTPFVLRSDSDDEVEFKGQFELRPGDQTIFLAVDIGAWFDGVNFDEAIRDDQGRILLGHDGSYPNLIDDNIEGSVTIALDADGDRMLTPADDDHGESEEPEED